MTSEKTSYGVWPSPISPRMMGGAARFEDVQWSPDGRLLWLESRAGTSTLVEQRGAEALREVSEVGTSIRGAVGYGGGEFTASRNATAYVASGGTLFLHRSTQDAPRSVAGPKNAAPVISPDEQWILYLHAQDGEDHLAAASLQHQQYPRRLFGDADFVMQPVWSPSGAQIAFVVWDVPQMPWDGTRLLVGDVRILLDDALHLENIRELAGGPDISVFQPAFSPSGEQLAYVSDQSGWWHVWCLDFRTGEHRQLTHDEAEYAVPAWRQGMRTIAWTGEHSILAIRSQDARHSLVAIDVASATSRLVSGLESYTAMSQLSVSEDGTQAALIASGTVQQERIINLDVEAGICTIRRRSATENLSVHRLIEGRSIRWTDERGDPVHGVLYAPETAGPTESRPPLIAMIHGGPTSQVGLNFSMLSQFFATRGYAVLHVNHRGSTGYGKAYKDRHRLSWGLYDVQDAASGALFLAENSVVDPAKRVIYGGSAGGYTVLQSLVDMPGFWTAGISLYGISNQFTLATEATFRFEAHYSETLLGPLPQSAERYRDRSPIFHVDRIQDPLLLFQGEDDDVVPRSQSDAIVDALRQRGVPVEYHVFPGEGHGWRKPETIESYLNTTLRFLRQTVIYR